MTRMEELFEIDQLTILDANSLKFMSNDSGYLSLEYNNKQYNKVNLTRLIPFQTTNQYISVNYEDDEKNFHEIGVIKDIHELPEQQEKLVNDYLEFKYYMPEITKVYSIKDNNRGFLFVKADTTSGEKTIAIRDWYSNFKMLTDKMLYVVDADGNKYYAPDINCMDKKSRYQIELFV